MYSVGGSSVSASTCLACVKAHAAALPGLHDNRTPLCVQVAVRFLPDQPASPVGFNMTSRPFTPVFSKTAALAPLVFENESHVQAERKYCRLVSEKTMESSRYKPWHFTLTSGLPTHRLRREKESFQSFSQRQERVSRC
jgi:hypothetical protein